MVCSRHPSSPPQTGEGQGPANLLEMAGRKRALTRQLLGALWRLASSLVATTAGVQSVVRRSRLQSRCLPSLNDGMAGGTWYPHVLDVHTDVLGGVILVFGRGDVH